MEEEVERKVFYKKDYNEVKELEEAAENFAKTMRAQYPDCMVSKEYEKNENILVRVTTIRQRYKTERIMEKERQREMERDRGRGRQRQRSR